MEESLIGRLSRRDIIEKEQTLTCRLAAQPRGAIAVRE